MSVRSRQEEGVGNGVVNARDVTSIGENRLEELYQLGRDQSLDLFKDEVVTQNADNAEGLVDIGSPFDWGRRQYQKAVHGTQFTYINSEGPSKNGPLISWKRGDNFGTSSDYVKYIHNFPPFMVKKYNGGGNIDEYVSIKPLSVLVTMADGDKCFKIDSQDVAVLSTCSKDKSVEEHMFRIRDIDIHFPEVKKYIMSAYDLYETEHIKSRPKGMHIDDATAANDPAFTAPRPKKPTRW